MRRTWTLALCLIAALAPAAAQAQAPTPPPPYGPPITLEQAKKVAAAAEAEARKNSWNVVIAIVDGGGNLVYLQRQDNTQIGSLEVARGKAWTAAAFRRSTKTYEDGIIAGGVGLRALGAPGVVPIEGGLPIVVDGKLIGAIGVSGVQSSQDAQIAKAGTEALK